MKAHRNRQSVNSALYLNLLHNVSARANVCVCVMNNDVSMLSTANRIVTVTEHSLYIFLCDSIELFG